MVSAIFWTGLWRQDRELPILEMGSFYMLAIVVYSVVPLLSYLLSGLEFSVLSHGRLYRLNPTPHQFATPAWGYVFFMITFAYAYLRWRPAPPPRTDLAAPKRTVVAVVSLFLLLNGAFLALRLLYGVNFATSYDATLYEHELAYQALPLVARQFVDHGDHMLMILNAAVATLLVSRWKSWKWRVALVGWLVALGLDYFLNPGSRFRFIAVVLFAILAYHRFVQPIRARAIVVAAALMATFFFGAGLLRTGTSTLDQGQVLQVVTENPRLVFSTANEFQIHYGGAIEFDDLLRKGMLDPIPWQIYASDILLLLPQQLLPFDKIDPVKWYVEQTGNTDFFSFGVLTQSMLGIGWLEMALRGLILGAILACIRRWWAVNPGRLWRNVFYIWMSVVIYQAARNTTFYFFAFILFEFLPLLILVWFIERLLSVKPMERVEA
jgi:hypothetical protein